MSRTSVRAVIGAMLGLATGQAAAQTMGPIVVTTYGPVQGTTTGAINSFLGIPYAAPPVGTLRWMPPAPPPYSITLRQATSYSAYCPQGLSEIGNGGGSEDCLYLNVQVPVTATATSNLPVMVWIHGGGLNTGSGQEYDGSALAAEGRVVLVTFNYRLGLLGFLAHPALAAEDTAHHSSGNYGLLDQQAALAWVRQNAVAFGGNPANISIFGESAGGQSVIDQLVSPLNGKLHTAIIESGAYARSLPTQAEAQATGQQIAALAAVGCATQTAACLRTVPATTLVNVVTPQGTLNGTINVSPNVDGYVLPQQPFQAYAAGNFQHVPVIDGTNHDEYRLFVSENDLLGSGPITAAEYTAMIDATAGALGPQVLAEYPLSQYLSPNYAFSALATDYGFSCGAVLLDALIAQYTPVYAYELNDPNVPNVFLPPDPNMVLGDSHAAELPYLWPAFKNVLLNLGPANFSPAQQQLASGMRASWTSFARYGRPLNPHGGPWLRYSVGSHDFASLVSPSPRTTFGFFMDHKCDFWGPDLLLQAGLPANTQY